MISFAGKSKETKAWIKHWSWLLLSYPGKQLALVSSWWRKPTVPRAKDKRTKGAQGIGYYLEKKLG